MIYDDIYEKRQFNDYNKMRDYIFEKITESNVSYMRFKRHIIKNGNGSD
jgi:hypothetical protein